jgi:hypothetical protein
MYRRREGEKVNDTVMSCCKEVSDERGMDGVGNNKLGNVQTIFLTYVFAWHIRNRLRVRAQSVA